ncbi:hypothetical protein B0H13DRAFT_2320220 [Mycena leptocephala]|nr:hypothetical protein B0H13DRAFT_2320220 [Mycena leptocephala]
MIITLCVFALDAARDYPSSINLDRSDSRLSGAAYKICLKLLLHRPWNKLRHFIENFTAPGRQWGSTMVSALCASAMDPERDYSSSIESNRSPARLSGTVYNIYLEPSTCRAGSQTHRGVEEPVPKVPVPKIHIGGVFFLAHPTPLFLRLRRLPSPPTLAFKDTAASRSNEGPAHEVLGFFHTPSRSPRDCGSPRLPLVAARHAAALGSIYSPAHPPSAASNVGGPAMHEADVRKKSAAGDFTSALLSANHDAENAARVHDATVSVLPSTTLVFPVLLPSASLNPGFSRTCQFVLCLSTHPPPPPCWPLTLFGHPTTLWGALQAFPIPFALPQRSYDSERAQPAMNITAAHIVAKDKFLVVRAARPYAKEGAGSVYNVACVDDADIAMYRTGRLTGADLLARMTWKVGHSSDYERRQERLAQLEQLCNGGERFYKSCACGVRHREYFTFSSVGGFAQFRALMTGALLFMNEPLNVVYYPRSPTTSDIYDLIIQS